MSTLDPSVQCFTGGFNEGNQARKRNTWQSDVKGRCKLFQFIDARKS